MMSINKKIGLIRSLVIYNFKPFNKRKLRRFYLQFLKKGDLAFDIGAHTGNRSSSWLGIGAKVVAVEPQPMLVKYMEKHLGNNPDFCLIDKAVGAQDGVAKLLINESHPSVSTVSAEWTDVLKGYKSDLRWSSSINVEMITLDGLIAEKGVPQFCKIDVEGLEFEVLKGLSHPISNISFEFFPATIELTKQCLELIHKIGTYQYNWVLAETFRFQSEQWLSKASLMNKISKYDGEQAGDIYCRLKA